MSLFRAENMEVPKLVLDDLQLVERVTELLKPLVITQEKRSRMVKVLEEELDLGHQYGLDGKEHTDTFFGWVQPSEYRLTIYRYAIIVSFLKYR